ECALSRHRSPALLARISSDVSLRRDETWSAGDGAIPYGERRQRQYELRRQSHVAKEAADRLAEVPRQDDDVVGAIAQQHLVLDDRDVLARQIHAELERRVLLADIGHVVGADVAIVEQGRATARTGLADERPSVRLGLVGERHEIVA